MSGMNGLWYLLWIAVVVTAGIVFRHWYANNPERSQLIFWVVFVVLCPPLAIIVYLALKILRIRITVRTENSSHG